MDNNKYQYDIVLKVEIDKIQKCIYEMYMLIDTIAENARKHDLSLLRVRGGASGCDVYQGLPAICRIRDNIFIKYEDIINKHWNINIMRTMKTNRGFELGHFKDDYGVDCSIQESSAIEPHIWLGYIVQK